MSDERMRMRLLKAEGRLLAVPTGNVKVGESDRSQLDAYRKIAAEMGLQLGEFCPARDGAARVVRVWRQK